MNLVPTRPSPRRPTPVLLAIAAASVLVVTLPGCSSDATATEPVVTPDAAAGADSAPDGGAAEAAQPDGAEGDASDSSDAGGCMPTTCAELGAECGDAPDQCGGSLSCGACTGTDTCGGAGQNKCGPVSCTAKTCAQVGVTCGVASDHCGGVVTCGECPALQFCSKGVCCRTTELCGNGVDDNCDQQVDDGCVVDCTQTEGSACNTDMGYGDKCDASDNTKGCSPERFWAWCNRRNSAYPNIWDDYKRSWVEKHCGKPATLVDMTYTCTDEDGRVWNCG